MSPSSVSKSRLKRRSPSHTNSIFLKTLTDNLQSPSRYSESSLGPSSLCSNNRRCFVMRPLTRFRHSRKLEGFSSRRMIPITWASTIPVRFAISSKLVRSSHASRTMREISSAGCVDFMTGSFEDGLSFFPKMEKSRRWPRHKRAHQMDVGSG